MKKFLDSIDNKILEFLSLNCKMSHNDIATKVNLSRNAVRLRIERLERDGYIKGYTIIRGNPSSEGETIKALILVFRKERMRDSATIEKLRSIPEVVTCNIMSGEFDIILSVESDSPDKITTIWKKISDIPEVQNTITSFVLSSYR